MKFTEKLKKRINFLLEKPWKRDSLIILYSLSPSSFFKKREGRKWIGNYLEKKNYIKNNPQEKNFQLRNLKIFYNDRLPVGDIISILLSREPLIKNNFLNNSLIDFEQPYEFAGVFIEKNDIVIDAGSNIGLFSIFASQQIGGQGTVFSFEPITKTNYFLNRNIKTNCLTNIKNIPYALGEAEKEINFYVNKDKLVSSSSEIKNKDTEIERAQQTTLDNFIEKNPEIKKVDFIKVDIEGAERKFLDGAKKTIQKFKPKIAICIYHLPDDPEIIEQKIRSFVPEYKIAKTRTKLFAWIERQ